MESGFARLGRRGACPYMRVAATKIGRAAEPKGGFRHVTDTALPRRLDHARSSGALRLPLTAAAEAGLTGGLGRSAEALLYTKAFWG